MSPIPGSGIFHPNFRQLTPKGIMNEESFIRGNLQYMQFTKGYIHFFIVHIDVGCWLLEKVCLEETHIT